MPQNFASHPSFVTSTLYSLWFWFYIVNLSVFFSLSCHILLSIIINYIFFFWVCGGLRIHLFFCFSRISLNPYLNPYGLQSQVCYSLLLSVYMSVCLSLSVCLSMYLSLSVSLSLSLSVCVSASVCMSVCLSVCSLSLSLSLLSLSLYRKVRVLYRSKFCGSS